MTARDDLRLLIAAGLPLISVEAYEELRAIELLRTLATRLDVALSPKV